MACEALDNPELLRKQESDLWAAHSAPLTVPLQDTVRVEMLLLKETALRTKVKGSLSLGLPGRAVPLIVALCFSSEWSLP